MPRNGYKIFLRKIFLEKATRESLWKSMKIAKFPRVKKKKKKRERRLTKTQLPLSQSAHYSKHIKKKK